MCGKFSKYIIFLCLIALTSLPAHGQQRQGGTGKGNGKGQHQASICQDRENPTLTLTIDGNEHWVHTPDEVMALSGNIKMAQGKNKQKPAIGLSSLMPEGWPENMNVGRVSFVSCKGQRINIPGPHLKKMSGQYILTKNQKGLLKLIHKKEKSERVLMRDLRKIDIR